MKTCPKCRYEIDDLRLVACPECGASLSESSLDLSQQDEDQILRKLWRRLLKYLFGGFSVLTIISIVLLVGGLIKAYNSGTAQIEKILVKRVSQEFETTRIQEIVEKAAKDQASDVLNNQISPVVEEFKEETQRYLNEIREIKQKVQLLEIELKNVANMAKPPTLKLHAAQVNEKEAGLGVILQFKPSRDTPLGRLDFKVKIANICDTKILNAEPSVEHHAYTGGPARISDDGKQASFNFAIIGGASYPTLRLVLSGKAILHISGSKMEKLEIYSVTDKTPNK